MKAIEPCNTVMRPVASRSDQIPRTSSGIGGKPWPAATVQATTGWNPASTILPMRYTNAAGTSDYYTTVRGALGPEKGIGAGAATSGAVVSSVQDCNDNGTVHRFKSRANTSLA